MQSIHCINHLKDAVYRLHPFVVQANCSINSKLLIPNSDGFRRPLYLSCLHLPYDAFRVSVHSLRIVLLRQRSAEERGESLIEAGADRT